MLCDWKGPIDAGEFIVLIVDKCQIDNPEVEMQATYASLTGKVVLAMIEKPGQPAKYMTEMPGFLWESFNPDDKSSFDDSMSKLIMRHKEIRAINRSKIGFICYSGAIDCEKIMRDGL